MKTPDKIYVKISHPISDEYTEIISALATEDGECRAFKEAKANNTAYIIEDGWIVRVYADNHKEKIKYVGETTVKINNGPKIKGWVARDDDLNHIHLFHNKPLRSKWTWACGYPALQLPDSFMPELKWEDEPVEVELIINKI